MAESESLEHLSHEMAQGIVRDWIKIHLDLMRAGTGHHGQTEQAVQEAIDQVQHLHLAEHHLLVTELFKALKLSGWTPPSGIVPVTYQKEGGGE